MDLDVDPKLAFALRQPDLFPVDINTADYAMVLRVPGIGLRSAQRIASLRRQGQIRWEHLRQMGDSNGPLRSSSVLVNRPPAVRSNPQRQGRELRCLRRVRGR